MSLDQLVPLIFFVAVLFLVLPSFFRSITKSKQFFKYRNLFKENTSIDSVYSGRIIEQNMAEEILEKIDQGTSGALYVSSK